MSPGDAAFLSKVRADAEGPDALLVIVGRVAIFAEDIVGKSDDELLVLIKARLAE
jgi:hypothetical protein